ncbi:MAG: orotate phosphoribosyltransferase, partial [Carnobacterium sp.]|nr:orotate phosphoribosyltransferase [Carnobacterium sp.]
GSVIDAAVAAKNEGADVIGAAAIFTYELPKGIENFKKHQLSFATLTNYSTLIDVALELGTIEANDLNLLKEWKQDPTNWKK